MIETILKSTFQPSNQKLSDTGTRREFLESYEELRVIYYDDEARRSILDEFEPKGSMLQSVGDTMLNAMFFSVLLAD